MPGWPLLCAQIKLQDVQHCLFIRTYVRTHTCQRSSVHVYMLMLLLMHNIAHFHHHTPPLPSTHSRTYSSIDSCHLIKVRTYTRTWEGVGRLTEVLAHVCYRWAADMQSNNSSFQQRVTPTHLYTEGGRLTVPCCVECW